MHLPAGIEQVEETIKQTQLAQSGMGIGGVMMAASCVLIVLAVLLIIVLGASAPGWSKQLQRRRV